MGYMGDVEVMVTRNAATAAIGGTLTAVMSNLETADGDSLVFTVGGTDRAVRDVIFSGISVTANDDDNLEFTGASQSLGVEFVERARQRRQLATPLPSTESSSARLSTARWA